jgi:predicted lipid carrier protein YhbT
MPVKTGVITRAMNAMFSRPLEAGELEFLTQQVMNIFVTDAGLRFSVRLDKDKLRAGNEVAEADVTIEGTVYTFLLLATRKEDADTLFFHRQLKTSGNTELGLHVKNFLDGLEPETLPYYRTIDPILRTSLAVADRVEKIRGRLSNLRPPFN